MLLLHAIDGVFDSTEQESTPEWMIRLGGEWLPFALVFTCGWIPVPDKPRGDRKVQKIIKPVKKQKSTGIEAGFSEPISKKSFHHQRTSNAHSTFGYANSRRIIPRICIMLDVFQSAFPVINLQEALLPLET